MPARRQLLPMAVAFAATALLLVACSSGDSDGTSAKPSPTPTAVTPTAPSSTAPTPSATPTTPGPGTPSTGGPSRPGTAPELRITSLRPGGTIALPATLGYTITGLRFTASDGYRLHLSLGGSGSYSLDLPLDGPAGTVTIPLDKMLPGKRDLSFTVVRADEAPAWSAQHATRVADVTIDGPK